ncbi:MAG: NUDIX domain-containing protein [Ilumatobacteraceae bacterium]
MGFRDGDGWVFCQRCNSRHWGVYGAAGLLMVRTDLPEPHVLLQLRAVWTHGGGTWSIPGGALDSHEDPVEAAVREAWEEVGVDVNAVEVKDVFLDDHLNWGYYTVIAHVRGDVLVDEGNYESDAVAWVPIPEVESYPLHAGLANSWPELRPRVTATLG